MTIIYQYLIYVHNHIMVNYYIQKHGFTTGREVEHFMKELKTKDFNSIYVRKEITEIINGMEKLSSTDGKISSEIITKKDVKPDIYVILLECESSQLDTSKIRQANEKLMKYFPIIGNFNIIVKTYKKN